MRSVDVPVADIVRDLGGKLLGSPSLRVARIMSLQSATPSDISFLSSAKYAAQFATRCRDTVVHSIIMSTLLISNVNKRK